MIVPSLICNNKFSSWEPDEFFLFPFSISLRIDWRIAR